MNLAGKDYFTEEEAAHYACVSVSQFRAKKAEYGLQSFAFMGKKLYRKVDLQGALEREWQRSPLGAATTSSHGLTRTRRNADVSRSARSGQSQSGTSTTFCASRNTNSQPERDFSTQTVVPLHASKNS